MEFSVKAAARKSSAVLVFGGVFEPRRLSPVVEQLDKISDGYISALLRRGELEGKGQFCCCTMSRMSCPSVSC
ncbi:hypothetical protein ACNKHW_26645 [Shigella flexneri]